LLKFFNQTNKRH